MSKKQYLLNNACECKVYATYSRDENSHGMRNWLWAETTINRVLCESNQEKDQILKVANVLFAYNIIYITQLCCDTKHTMQCCCRNSRCLHGSWWCTQFDKDNDLKALKYDKSSTTVYINTFKILFELSILPHNEKNVPHHDDEKS